MQEYFTNEYMRKKIKKKPQQKASGRRRLDTDPTYSRRITV